MVGPPSTEKLLTLMQGMERLPGLVVPSVAENEAPRGIILLLLALDGLCLSITGYPS